MAVIVGPSRAEIMRPFLQQWMSNMSQRDMENERLQQQAPLVQAQTDYTKAQTGETQQKTKLDLANSAAAGALARYQSIVKDDPQQAAAYIQQVIQAIPETAPILRSWGIAGPTTQTDVANAGAAKTMANQATSAAGGSEDAQARNTAFMLGTGQQLSPTAMTDQVQRQTKQSGIADAGTDYGKTVRTEGKLLPTGGEQLQAKTQTEMNAAQISAEAPVRAAQAAAANAQAGEATESTRGKKLSNDMLAQSVATGPSAMVDDLVNRRASLDDFAKTGTPLRRMLIQSMPQGLVAPANEKERQDLVGADSTARLMKDRIAKLRELAPVVDNSMNRLAIAGLVDASDNMFTNWVKGSMRNGVDDKTLDYIQELRNLREDQFALRKYLGNSPVRSDKQVGIMLGQSVGADAGNSKDVARMLDVFEPAVNRLIIGNQTAGAPAIGGSQASPAPSGGKVITYDNQGNRVQ